MEKPDLNISGKVFGRLTVIEPLSEPLFGVTKWRCLCSCGKEHVTMCASLITGHTKSCGCLALEIRRKVNIKHGESKDGVIQKEYMTWTSIKQRCDNPKNKSYPRYGGKGIKFQYSNSFEDFLKEVGRCPNIDGRWSIDRIDNTKGYIEGNMRWATDKQQANNKGIYKNNTSGKTGVLWRVIKKTTCAVASWSDEENKSRSKAFSAKKYGLLEAFAMACAYRDKNAKCYIFSL